MVMNLKKYIFTIIAIMIGLCIGTPLFAAESMPCVEVEECEVDIDQTDMEAEPAAVEEQLTEEAEPAAVEEQTKEEAESAAREKQTAEEAEPAAVEEQTPEEAVPAKDEGQTESAPDLVDEVSELEASAQAGDEAAASDLTESENETDTYDFDKPYEVRVAPLRKVNEKVFDRISLSTGQTEIVFPFSDKRPHEYAISFLDSKVVFWKDLLLRIELKDTDTSSDKKPVVFQSLFDYRRTTFHADEKGNEVIILRPSEPEATDGQKDGYFFEFEDGYLISLFKTGIMSLKGPDISTEYEKPSETPQKPSGTPQKSDQQTNRSQSSGGDNGGSYVDPTTTIKDSPNAINDRSDIIINYTEICDPAEKEQSEPSHTEGKDPQSEKPENTGSLAESTSDEGPAYPTDSGETGDNSETGEVSADDDRKIVDDKVNLNPSDTGRDDNNKVISPKTDGDRPRDGAVSENRTFGNRSDAEGSDVRPSAPEMNIWLRIILYILPFLILKAG